MTFHANDGTDQGTYNYTGVEPGEVQLLSFYYGFIKTFNEIQIQSMRDFFTSNPRAVCFRDETGNNKVHIAEAFSFERQSFPAAIVDRTDLNLQDLYLGNKQGGLFIETSGGLVLVGERLGGRCRINTSWKLAAFQTPARDALSDIILYALVGPVRWDLLRKGFAYIPNSASIGPQAVEEVEKLGGALYTRTFSFSVEGEWYDDFYYNGVEIRDFRVIFERIQL